MDTITIREIQTGQAKTYNVFIGRGLIEDASHFRISPADAVDSALPTTGRPDSFTLGAFVGTELAGVGSFERDGKNREKLRHKGILFRVYVAPEFRGRGIAGSICREIISRARQLPNMDAITLTVIGGNAAAKRIYESLGFVTYGSEPAAIKWNAEYFDEDLMRLQI